MYAVWGYFILHCYYLSQQTGLGGGAASPKGRSAEKICIVRGGTKVNKRLLATLLALCMMLSLLSACGERQERAEMPEDTAPQEQDAPLEEPNTPPEEQDTPETPPRDDLPRIPDDAAPLKLYDELCSIYQDFVFVSTFQPYIIGENLYSPDNIYTYRYESNVIFEGSEELAEQLLEEGKNPGLGVRGLHEQGITGEGVNVAIIDQNLLLDHPEYADCIVDYYDSGCGEDIRGSMHGPAVLSLLAGETVGVAPGAKVYYAAAPSWKTDASYYADCLYWIIEQNEALPEGEKIRVVSVSAAPEAWSGGGGFMNGEQWAEAVAAAEAEGMLVIDCRLEEKTGFVRRSYCMKGPSDDPNQYRPGTPRNAAPKEKNTIFAPASFRTTAQEYTEGEYIYTHWGEGGLSWSVPYAAGVLALGWQVNPDLDARVMKDLLLASAWVNEDGCRMIDPPAFIELVRATVE